jgi:hypothetical protein
MCAMPSDTCRFDFLRALLALDPDCFSAIFYGYPECGSETGSARRC